MPLGKLTKKMLKDSCGVLEVLQDMLSRKEPPTETQLTLESNRFYTLLPHNTGTEDPPLINSLEVIQTKLQMIEDLKGIEIAYKIMCIQGSDFTVDNCYEQLHNIIQVLDTKSDEFKAIKICVENIQWKPLKIKYVFKICRNGEERRFKPFESCPNRLMLWHGSRQTNWAGILSEGLRIQPEGATVNGSKLGRGVYFADSVSFAGIFSIFESKSKNRLILLCEVALGNMALKRKSDPDLDRKMDADSAVLVSNIDSGPNGKEICGVLCPWGKLVLNADKRIKYEMDGRVYSGDEILREVMEKELFPDDGSRKVYNAYNVYNEERVLQRFLVWLD